MYIEPPAIGNIQNYISLLVFIVKKYTRHVEGSELSQKLGQLKLQSADGKYYLTDVADTEQLFRLIQSIPSSLKTSGMQNNKRHLINWYKTKNFQPKRHNHLLKIICMPRKNRFEIKFLNYLKATNQQN